VNILHGHGAWGIVSLQLYIWLGLEEKGGAFKEGKDCSAKEGDAFTSNPTRNYGFSGSLVVQKLEETPHCLVLLVWLGNFRQRYNECVNLIFGYLLKNNNNNNN
jgi:hypothetical protein